MKTEKQIERKLSDLMAGDEVIVLRNGAPDKIAVVGSVSSGAIELRPTHSNAAIMRYDIETGDGRGRNSGGSSIVPSTDAMIAELHAIAEKKAAERREYAERMNQPSVQLLRHIGGEIEHNINKYADLPIDRVKAACEALGIDTDL